MGNCGIQRVFAVATTDLNLTNIQGNVLKGFNKDYQLNLFLKFKDPAAGRAWIKDIAEEVKDSCSANVIQFNNEFSRLRRHGIRLQGRRFPARRAWRGHAGRSGRQSRPGPSRSGPALARRVRPGVRDAEAEGCER